MKDHIRSLSRTGPEFLTQHITPRILFLLCMEHPLSNEKIQQRLCETCLCGKEDYSAGQENNNCLKDILENLSCQGILFRNPDDSFELNKDVEVRLRSEISGVLAKGGKDNPAALLLRREASNFLARARQIREDFQKKVYEALRPEFHDLRSQRAREIIQQQWDDVDHKRVYSSLHSIFDMLPMGLIDFGIRKEAIAFEERFFNQTDDEMCNYIIEQIEDAFIQKRRALEQICRGEMDKTLPEIVRDFRSFLEEGPAEKV